MPVKKKSKSPEMKLNRTENKVITLWKDEFYLKGYELAKEGLADSSIRKACGVGPETWKKWLTTKPVLVEAIEKGRLERFGKKEVGDFLDYIHERLPRELRSIWDRIVELDGEGDEERLESLLAEQGTRAKQHLWLHAYGNSLFSQTEACRRTCVKMKTVQEWKERDADFADLVDNVIFQAKKDFCESAMFKLVLQGDASIIRFANETLNADRGYNKKTDLRISGSVQHQLQESREVTKILDSLPLDDQLKLLEAIRNAQTKTVLGTTIVDSPNLLPAHREETIDAN